MDQQQQGNEFIVSVPEIQQRLKALGLDVSPDNIVEAKKRKPREEILRALAAAGTNQRARAYLDELFKKAPAQQTAPAPSTVSTNPTPAPQAVAQLPVAPRPNPPSLVRRAQPREALQHNERGNAVPTVRTPDPVAVQPITANNNSTRASLHIYGGKAALTIEGGENRNGKPVVFIDAAPAVAEREYDWGQKIRLMLTPAEVVTVLAVALGYVPRAEFKNHGEEKDKWFVVENQKKNLFIKVGQGKTLRAVPVSAIDAFHFAALLTAQVRNQVPQQAGADVQALVRLVVAPMLTAAA